MTVIIHDCRSKADRWSPTLREYIRPGPGGASLSMVELAFAGFKLELTATREQAAVLRAALATPEIIDR